MENLKKYIVNNQTSIRESVKQLDNGGIGFLVIVDENNYVIGVLTDGDFRRAILNGINLTNSISSIMNKSFKFLEKDYNKSDVEKLLRNSKVRHIPIIKDEKLVDIITEKSFVEFDDNNISQICQIDLPVVIMAGGKGTRLDPFTRILPKPLIPIGDKAMIEVIMDEYAKFGMKNFHISINHKGKMVKAYLEDHESDYLITYINEDKPLGTAGALKYLAEKIQTSFFVSNCDIIIKDDYTKIYEFHKIGNYDLTIVASMQHHTIPYGVCEIENGGNLKSITEKPQYDFLVNTGMYILNSEVLKYIPEDGFFHITNLIEKLKEEGLSVGVYPVSEKSYIDVGQWDKYKKTIKEWNC